MMRRLSRNMDLARRTMLNRLFGHWYFRRSIAKRSERKSGERYIVLSFDPDETSDMERLPELLDLLKRYRMKGSFAAIGAWVEKYPQTFERMRDEGHEIINHTYSHPDNKELNPKHYHHLTRAQRAEEIRHCDEVVRKAVKVKMSGFRTPHFGYQHTKDTYPILEDMGYTFSSSVVAMDAPGGKPFKVGKITEFPLTYCPRHPWAIFDSSHAFRGRFTRHTPQQFLKDFEELVDSGVFLNIYLDPQDFDKYDFEGLLKILQKKKIKTVLYRDLL